MGCVYDQLEHAMEAAAADGKYLLQPELCIFQAAVDEQPLFQSYYEKEIRSEVARALTRILFSFACSLSFYLAFYRVVRLFA
eukprot:5809020-Pleurochrysis_carterae.AAC.1